jgi:hypothetical protein
MAKGGRQRANESRGKGVPHAPPLIALGASGGLEIGEVGASRARLRSPTGYFLGVSGPAGLCAGGFDRGGLKLKG